ncbi:hypothetical protein CP03DC29_0946B, partial [Chlamydia psittaci 03DC29]
FFFKNIDPTPPGSQTQIRGCPNYSTNTGLLYSSGTHQTRLKSTIEHSIN